MFGPKLTEIEDVIRIARQYSFKKIRIETMFCIALAAGFSIFSSGCVSASYHQKKIRESAIPKVDEIIRHKQESCPPGMRIFYCPCGKAHCVDW